AIVSPPSQLGKPLALQFLHRVVYEEDRHLMRLFRYVIVEADHDLLFAFESLLELIGRLLYLFLGETCIDRGYHTTHSVYAIEIFESALFHLVCELLDEIAAGKRIDRVYHARFSSNNLLRAQSDENSVLGRKR